MWEVKYPFREKFNPQNLDKILPVGYVAESFIEGRFSVRDEQTWVPVGFIEESETGLLIKFFDHIEAGQNFALAFGLIHPEQNPKRVMYGFVYESPETHLFQLDKRPYNLLESALVDLEDYDTAGNAWLVSFYQGEWHSDFLTVTNMRKVRSDATLAPDTGPRKLPMGQIENESTM